MAMGYHVIWPLKNEILWIKDYISDIQFCSIDDNFPGKEYYGQDVIIQSPQFVYLGIMKAHLWGNDYGIDDENSCAVMQSKYDLINLDWNQWSEGFKFTRNIDKENDLYYNVLGLKDNSEYVFVNKYANTENRKYGPFDFLKIIENAKEIHTVHTSINYLIELLNIKAKKYCMYQGNHQRSVGNIPFNIKKPEFIS